MPKNAAVSRSPSAPSAQSHRLSGRILEKARPSACAAAQSVETAPISRAKSWASVSSACTKPSRGRALERIVILAPQTC